MGSLSELQPMELGIHQPEVEKCHHFTIRGYVAEVRKRNRKLCWPFPFEEQGDELPPIDVPKFNYWECCSTNADMNNVEDNVERPSGGCSHGDASMSSPGDTVANNTPLSMEMQDGSQQALGETICDENTADASAAIFMNEVENNTPLGLDLEDVSQQASRENDSGTIYENGIENNTPLCIETLENEAVVTNPGSKDAYPFREDDVDAVRNEVAEGCEDVAALTVNRDTCPSYLLVDMSHNKRPRCKRNNPNKMKNQLTNEASSSRVPEAANHQKDESDQDISRNENGKRTHVPLGRSQGRGQKKSRRLSDIVNNEEFLMCMQDHGSNKDNNVDHASTEENNVDHASIDTNNVDHGSTEENSVDHGPNENNVDHGCNKNNVDHVSNRDGYFDHVITQDNNVDHRFNEDNNVDHGSNENNVDHISNGDGNVDHVTSDDNSVEDNNIDHRSSEDNNVDHGSSENNVDLSSNEDDNDDPPETQTEESSARSKRKLYLDLNLSPTHQVLTKNKKRRFIVDEDEESLATIFQKDLSKKAKDARVENAAEGDQPAASLNDQLLAARKKKGKMPLYEESESSATTWQDDTLRDVQTKDGNLPVQCNGAESASLNPVQNASSGRGIHSDIEDHMAGQSNGGEILRHNNRCASSQDLDGKGLQISSKRSIMAQIETGGSSSGHQLKNTTTAKKPSAQMQQFDQGANQTSKQACSDGIPMDIVELLAKNQHERYLGGRGNGNCLSQSMRNKVKDSNARDKSEDSGDEILRFLQKKKSQKRRSHSSNDRSISSAEAKRVGSANPSQSVGNTSQNSIQPSRIHSLPEPSLAPKGFTAFSPYQEKKSRGAQLLVGSPSRNSGNQNSILSKNQETPSSQVQFLAENSGRKSGNQTSIFSQKQARALSRPPFLFGGSTLSRNNGIQNPTFSRNGEISASGAQFLRTSGNQNSTFPSFREKPSSSSQFLSSSSRNDLNQNYNWDGKLGRHRYPQTSLQTSEAHQASRLLQNSYRNGRQPWSPMIPNRLPFGTSYHPQFAAEPNSTNQQSPCLELFPNGNINGDNSRKTVDPLANLFQKKNRNLDMETMKRAHPRYQFASRERGTQFNPQSMPPVDLYNKEAMPATDLLRLMDAGIRPSAPVNVDKNHKFNQQPYFLHHHHQQEMSRFGPSKNNEALMPPPSSNGFSRYHRPGKYTGNFPSIHEMHAAGYSAHRIPEASTVGPSAPAVPEVNTVGSSVSGVTLGFSLAKNDIVITDPGSGGSSFLNQLMTDSSKDPMNGKAKMKETVSQSKRARSNRLVSGNGTSGKNHELSPSRRVQKGLSTPESTMAPTPTLAMKDIPKPAEDAHKAGTSCLKPAEDAHKAGTSCLKPAEDGNKAGTSCLKPAEDGNKAGPSCLKPAEDGNEAGPSCLKPVENANEAGPSCLGKRSRNLEYCYMNRNPADFTLPDAGNQHMIGPEEIKLKENISPRKKTGAAEPVGRKRQKKAKLTALKRN